jgi:hypothetical protein
VPVAVAIAAAVLLLLSLLWLLFRPCVPIQEHLNAMGQPQWPEMATNTPWPLSTFIGTSNVEVSLPYDH